MFFSSPSADLKLIIILLIIALAVAVFTYYKTKKVLLSVFLMSVLGNLILFLNSGSRLFDMYEIKWVVAFTLDYWPYINLLLLIILLFNYLKNRHVEKNK